MEVGGLKIFQSLLDLAYMTPEELKVITGTKMKAMPKGRRGAKPAKAAKARPAVRAAKAAKPKAKAGKRKR
jgi:adenylylsulfate kinase